MSGPKVVRIVTREEIEAICRRHLANVDDAAAGLRRRAQRHDALTEPLIAHLDERIQNLQRLFEEERWDEVQKQAPVAVVFLKTEAQRIQADAIAAAARARSKRRGIAEAAATILAAMVASGIQPSAELRTVSTLAHFADDAGLRTMEAVVGENYAALTAHRAKSETSPQALELAQRLGAGERVQSFSEWFAAQTQPDHRLDALMAEIETLDDDGIARSFRERAAAIAGESSQQRRSLLTDSLVLDLSERARRRREQEAAMSRLHEVHAALRTLDAPEAQAMASEIAAALEAGNGDGADDLIVRAESVVAAAMARLAADARRRAVLGGLAQLGYEVREGMSTIWAREGRLVVRKPDATDYGVEVGAAPDVSRLQVRVVGAERPAAPRDPHRDRDMETTWCSEFARLQALLAEAGGHVVLERAVAPGMQAVKTVAFPDADRDVRRKVQPMQRLH